MGIESDGLGSVHKKGFRTLKVGTARAAGGMSLVVPMELHGVNLRFLVDTGAVVTVLSSSLSLSGLA